MSDLIRQPKRLYWDGSFLLTILILLNCGCGGAKDKGEAFRRFFSSVPTSVQVIEYGGSQRIYGDGSYVLVFKMPQPDLKTFLEQQGYTSVGIETDPNHWRLELCNSIVGDLVKFHVQITPAFDCYSKETDQNRVRIFYDKTQNLAVFVGGGRFKK